MNPSQVEVFLLPQWIQTKSPLILCKPTLWFRFLNPVLGGVCSLFVCITHTKEKGLFKIFFFGLYNLGHNSIR